MKTHSRTILINFAMLRILFMLLICWPLWSGAEVYQWKDADGKKHFSDRPTSLDAEKIVIKTSYGFFRVKSVYDGDTVVLEDGKKIRLLGINTPEVQHRDKSADAGGDEAKQWLTDKLKDTKVRVETDVEKTDSYGRTLGHLFTEKKEHINVLLVAAGLAEVSIWPPNLKYAKELISAGQQAEAGKLGIWQRPEYAPIPVEQLTEDGHRGWTRLVGKVRQINIARKFVYLEFTDRFNARIEKDSLSLFPDINSYQGKIIEVRGWLNKRKDQYSMLIRHPSAIK